MITVEDAIRLAAKAHEFQTRWNGEPYILHPLRVMMKQHDNTARIVAVLHDVVEDTNYGLMDLRRMGCDDVLIRPAIKALTKLKKQSYDEYIKQVSRSQLATEVKLADLEDNMNILQSYMSCNIQEDRLRKYFKAYQHLKRIVFF